MKRIVAFPYATADEQRVIPDKWLLVKPEQEEILPERIVDWDYNFDLSLRRHVRVDAHGIRSDCGLSAKDQIGLVATWHSPGTYVRGSTSSYPLGDSTQEFLIELGIRGLDIAYEVRLRTIVFLISKPETIAFAAHIPGSVLWKDEIKVTVEGSASRFPIESLDFSSTSWAPEDAAWYLQFPTDDMHQPFLGVVRLYINSTHKRLIEAISAPNPDREARAITSTLYYDVGRAMISRALADDSFVSGAEHYSDGSVGLSVIQLIRTLFPTDSILGLRNTLKERPAEFDSLMQQQLQLFRD